jgi:hypothetical protein
MSIHSGKAVITDAMSGAITYTGFSTTYTGETQGLAFDHSGDSAFVKDCRGNNMTLLSGNGMRKLTISLIPSAATIAALPAQLFIPPIGAIVTLSAFSTSLGINGAWAYVGGAQWNIDNDLKPVSLSLPIIKSDENDITSVPLFAVP